MPWSWSHTQEAYDYAEARCRELPRRRLVEIYAEWRAYRPTGRESSRSEAFDNAEYDRFRPIAERLASPVLAERIWERAREQATCENGGHQAWLCPFGCGPHLVRFGPEEE